MEEAVIGESRQASAGGWMSVGQIERELAKLRTNEDGAHRRLETGGEYQWRREGEVHLFNPETVFLLQHATRSRQYDVFEQYTRTVDDLSEEAATLRGPWYLSLIPKANGTWT